MWSILTKTNSSSPAQRPIQCLSMETSIDILSIIGLRRNSSGHRLLSHVCSSSAIIKMRDFAAPDIYLNAIKDAPKLQYIRLWC